MRLSRVREDDASAAARIQLRWREHRASLRREARRLADLAAAASVVQRCWRTHLVRRGLRRLLAFGLDAVRPTWPTVSLIQRCFRNARLRRRWYGIIDTLNDRYLTDGKLRSEAENNSRWYTPAMMLRRERMYRDDKVQTVLYNAWRDVTAASSCSVPGDEDATSALTLTWPQYAEISRKVSLCVLKRNDAREAFLLAKIDWERDTRGWPDEETPLLERRMDKEAFFLSWFQLADVCTSSMEVADYTGFVERIGRAIVRRDSTSGACALNSDVDVMRLVANWNSRNAARCSQASTQYDDSSHRRQTVASRAAQSERANTRLAPPKDGSSQGSSQATPKGSTPSSPKLRLRAISQPVPPRIGGSRSTQGVNASLDGKLGAVLQSTSEEPQLDGASRAKALRRLSLSALPGLASNKSSGPAPAPWRDEASWTRLTTQTTQRRSSVSSRSSTGRSSQVEGGLVLPKIDLGAAGGDAQGLTSGARVDASPWTGLRSAQRQTKGAGVKKPASIDGRFHRWAEMFRLR